jgi:hypothetical protein
MVFEYEDITKAILVNDALKSAGIQTMYKPNQVQSPDRLLKGEGPLVHLVEINDEDCAAAKTALSQRCLLE